MKLNNKGITLIELIISVVLISVVMLFMYGLLNDVNNENNDTSYAADNQVNRSEIIKEIEEDFLSIRRVNLTEIVDASTADRLKVTFNFANRYGEATASILEATKDELTYTDTEGEIRKWTMKNAEINNQKVGLHFEKSSIDTYAILLSLDIYTDNDLNRVSSSCSNCVNNLVDDIIISVIGNYENEVYLTKGSNKKALDSNSCLGHNC